MNEQAIKEQYNSIVTLLEQKRLKEAQTQLEAFLWNGGDWTLRNRLEEARTSYQYMLQYMRQGIDDPERQKLYIRLLAETWEVADQVQLSLLEGVSTHYYIGLRRNYKHPVLISSLGTLRKKLEAFPDEMAICRLTPNDQQSLNKVLDRHENAQKDLFLTTWCNSVWTAEEATEAHDILTSEVLDVTDLCMFISAVNLSLMECFDSRKLSWLMDAYTHADSRVSQRALVGIVLIMHIYSNRILLYPDLAARLSLLNENPDYTKQLNNIYIQLLRSKDTDKIDKKMREEIIPGVIKNANIMRNMKLDFDDSSEDNDRNPDWEKALENSGLEEKIREISDLQMEGADVYMSTFSMLKRFPFFHQCNNWFLPFTLQHSSLIRQYGLNPTQENSFLNLLQITGFLCDSDKYSLCFTLGQIPEKNRGMMMHQMVSQEMSAFMEQEMESGKQHARRPNMVSQQYIHDLYRFFKLNQYKNEMRDIFKEEIALHRLPIFKEVLCEPSSLKEVADFHFQKEHYMEALDIYQMLIDNNQANADTFQKTGYCLQKEKRYTEAIDAYRRADVLNPDHVWTLRHLATCYRLKRDFVTALEYYKKVADIQPDNKNILFLIGSCLTEQSLYAEALQYFFRLDFMDEDNIKAWRAIGWCSFASGKYEQAMKYYDKVLAHHPLAADYLNAGHVAWKMGNMDKVAEYYGRSMMECGSKDKFLEIFNEDKELLLSLGIAEEDIPLILDMV